MSGTLSPSATPAREGLENCSEIANVEGGGGWESFFMLSLRGGGGWQEVLESFLVEVLPPLAYHA